MRDTILTLFDSSTEHQERNQLIHSTKHPEEALSQQTTLLSILLDSIPDLVFFKDNDGIYLGCNPEFARFVGKTRDQIIGKSDYEIFPKKVADSFRANDLKARKESIPRHNEEWVLYPDGDSALLDTVKAPLKDIHGNVVGLLGVSRNITKRKEAENRLKEHAHLERLIANISARFISISHSETDQAIETSMGEIARAEGLTRAYIFKFSSDLKSFSNTHEWCSEETASEKENFQNILSSNFPWWIKSLKRFQNVIVSDLTQLPPEAASEKELFEARKVNSFFTVPMVWEGRLQGFMGLESTETCIDWDLDKLSSLELLAGICINAMKRKEAEENLEVARLELKKSQERWRYALEGSGQGAWDWNIQTDEVFFSKEWKTMLGFEEHEIESFLSEWERRVHPEDIEIVKNDIENHLQGRTPIYSNEHRILCKNGEYKWILDSGKVASWTSDGSPLRMSGTHTDITEKKQAETLLREVSAMKSKFTSIASHELRTPVATLKTASEMLMENLSKKLDQENLSLLALLKRTVERLERLTTDMLDFKKLEAGAMKYDFEKRSINEPVEEAFRTMLPVAEKKGLKLELNVDPEDRETLLDQDKIVEVMLNLLNNAIRFTEEGSVLISTLQDGNACKVSVSDTGQGIPNEQLKDLFLPFVQLYGKNQKNNERGTGLGLAISKEMVEGHGGTIWAESQLGSGTIMSFTIPS